MTKEDFKKRLEELYAPVAAECPDDRPGVAHADGHYQHRRYEGGDSELHCEYVERVAHVSTPQLTAWEEHSRLVRELGGGPDGVPLEQ